LCRDSGLPYRDDPLGYLRRKAIQGEYDFKIKQRYKLRDDIIKKATESCEIDVGKLGNERDHNLAEFGAEVVEW